MNHINTAKRYDKLIPVSSIKGQSTDQEITVELTGFSGDFMRTCIFYEIADNVKDYLIKDAFIIDDKERIYCLHSSHRKIDEDAHTWIEFSPVSPDARSLELHITKIQQSPTSGAVKLRGESFIDPWAPALNSSREVFEKVVSWSKTPSEDIFDKEWEKTGCWKFEIPLGVWTKDARDIIKPLDFFLTFGRETIHFLEFRNSNTGAFVAFEACDAVMRQIRDNFKEKVYSKFHAAENMEDFERALGKMGLDRGYVPVNINIYLKDNDRNIVYAPDFTDACGVINNRLYSFFDDCICSGDMEIWIREIENLKLAEPLEFCFDTTTSISEDLHILSVDAGTIQIQGSIVFEDPVCSLGQLIINYKTNVQQNLEHLELQDARIIIEKDGRASDEIPLAGIKTRITHKADVNKKQMNFPMPVDMDSIGKSRIRLKVKSLKVKLKSPIILPFRITN